MPDPTASPQKNQAISSSGRIKALDGFRGIAVLSIVLLHYVVHHVQVEPATLPSYARQYLMFLWIGVDAFFVLSGFLIGGILLDQRTTPNYFRVFYLRRSLRIFPPYFLLIICWWIGSALLDQPGRHWLLASDFPQWPYFLYVQNFWMALHHSVGPLFVAATWSLAVEEQFYLLFPVVVRWVAPQLLLRVLLGGIIIAPLLRMTGAMLGPQWQTAQDYLLPARWDSLLLGALVAWVVRQPAALSWIAARRTRAEGLLGLAAILVALMPLFPRNPAPALVWVGAAGLHLFIALFFSMILLFMHLHWIPRLTAFLSGPVWCYFGRVSYSVYLFHTAILGLMFSVTSGKDPVLSSWRDFGVMITAFVGTVAFAHLTWLLFEQRLIGLGHKYSYRRTAHPHPIP